jgi:hypothetical protein
MRMHARAIDVYREASLRGVVVNSHYTTSRKVAGSRIELNFFSLRHPAGSTRSLGLLSF